MITTIRARTTAAPVELDLDARLAAVDAAMTLRLDEAAVGWEVNTAHLPGVAVEHLPVDTPPAEDTTPVDALLRRAQQRILRDGWARTGARNNTGGRCLLEVLHAEARSHADESEARILLRRALGGSDPVPEQNRRLRNASQAAAVLGAAAALAERSGL